MNAIGPITAVEVLRTARELRATGKIRESYALVRATSDIPAGVIWQHHPQFWDEIAAGNCLLTRRTGTDAGFIRALWSDQVFAHRFHRLAVNLPARNEDLERILNSEYVSLIGDLNSLHWVVRDQQRQPWGVMSLTNISTTHQRAEVLLGVMDTAPFGLAPASMLLLFRFFYRVLKFQKLYTLTFDDNEHSLKGVLHLGFRQEGRFRKHVRDHATNSFVDVVQSGLLADEAFSIANLRMMRRLGLE